LLVIAWGGDSPGKTLTKQKNKIMSDIFSELERDEKVTHSISTASLKDFSTQELLDELYSRSHDKRINILVNSSQTYLSELKYNEKEIKKALEKALKQKVEGKISAAKSLL
jgi:mevalonate kinase